MKFQATDGGSIDSMTQDDYNRNIRVNDVGINDMVELGQIEDLGSLDEQAEQKNDFVKIQDLNEVLQQDLNQIGEDMNMIQPTESVMTNG